MALTDILEIPRRTMVLFFIIDTSGSMDGSKIGTVNTAIRQVVPDIRDISNENAEALIKIAVLEFSSGVTWRTPSGPVDSKDYNWTNLDAAGTTDFGAMCVALNEKLSTKAFMAEETGSYAPALVLLSDGGPTDDWQSGLEKLKQNNWFKASIKVALAVGEDADHDVLKEFTGSAEAVIDVKNKAVLLKMIKLISVRASQVASKSTNATQDGIDEQAKQRELEKSLGEFQKETASGPGADQEEW